METLGGWLKTCTINECTEYFRKIRKEQHYRNTVEIDELTTQSLEEQHEKTLDKTAKLINELPVAQRSIVYLHAVQNLKHREISASIDVKEETVRQSYKRALDTLKRWIGR